MNNNNNEPRNVDTKNTDRLILYGLALILFLLFAVTSLPTIISTIVITIILISIKGLYRIYFGVMSLVLAILINFKVSFKENYLLRSIDFLKIIFNTIIHGYTNT
ncbi:MAG TPA: hypothetical protein VIM42_00835, partial [Clostridium sp.]